MATINATTSEKVISLKAFLGINENPDGDNKLKVGEATVCKNFKVTNSGNLMKRYGSTQKYTLGTKPVMGMWHGWCTKHELTIAACDGHLWMLQDNDWLQTPTDLGIINTDNDVFMFGFNERVYMLNGVEYCEVESVDTPMPSSAALTVESTATAAMTNITLYDAFYADYKEAHAVFDYRDAFIAAGEAVVSGDIHDAEADIAVFGPAVAGNSGTYTFTYTLGDWYIDGEVVTIGDYGITYSGTAGEGDQIIAEYGPSAWYFMNTAGDMSSIGITVTGAPTDGDTITVDYTPAYVETAWTMTNISDGSHGYRPLVSTGIGPNGGGALLEEVNKLNGQRRVWISGDGDGVTFTMPETFVSVDSVINLQTQAVVPPEDYSWTANTNTVTFDTAPALATNSYEIQYSVANNFADTIAKMRYAEMYAGTQDTRIFLYGDGSNRTFYSSIDYLGQPRADYFPDLYEVTVGDANTPITGLIRHYTKMLAFKPLETFSIDYGIVTLADGLMTPAFYTTPVNKNAGNQAVGQVQLVLNAPRSLCQGHLYEWRNGSSYSANLSVDERQAKRISDRIYATLQGMDFKKVHCYDDNLNTEYYIIDEDGNCLVQNYTADAWYYYTDLNARVAMAVDGKLYFGTKDGKIIMLDESKLSDMGRPIDCLWESGSMDFGASYMRKYSALMWVGVKAEKDNSVTVTVKTDRSEENTEVDVEPEYEFDMPKITRTKVKVKKFVYYKLCFKTKSANTRVTLVDTEIKVRYTAQAK